MQVYGVGGVQSQKHFPCPSPINTPGYPIRFLTVPVAGSLLFAIRQALLFSKHLCCSAMYIGWLLKYKRNYGIGHLRLDGRKSIRL